MRVKAFVVMAIMVAVVIVAVMIIVIVMIALMIVVVIMAFVVIMVFVIVVVMRLVRAVIENHPVAKAQLPGVGHFKQLDLRRVARHFADGLTQRRGQLGTDPDHEIRILKSARLGRTHGVSVRRPCRRSA